MSDINALEAINPQKPTVGRIVHYYLSANDNFRNNNSKMAPAIIVRVWSDTVVNLKVLTDGAHDAWVTSVRHISEHDDLSKTQLGWWEWPPR